jgi:type IV pilus assembly protein PilM
MFGGVSANALALDLGAHTIKVLALQRKGSRIRVVGVGIEKTQPFAIVDGQVMDQNAVVLGIKSAITKAGVGDFKGLPTVVGLRGVCVVCARLQLPQLGEEEMADQLLLEAQQHIDSDLAEWRIDYDVVTKADEQGQVVVMLVGARNSVLDSYVDILKSLQLSLDVVDLDVFALANAVESARGGEVKGNVLCLDIGKDATRIYLMSEGIPQIIRSASLGGNHLSAMISEMSGLPVDEAEQTKVNAMASSEKEMSPEIQRCVDLFIDELCMEIKNTIEFFTKSSGSESATRIDQIFVSGGAATVSGLTQKIATVFESQVFVLNPFSRIDVAPQVHETLGSSSHVYGVAVGLALRRKNDKNSVEKKKNAIPTAGNFKNLPIPPASRKIIAMLVGGALLLGLMYLGAEMYLAGETKAATTQSPVVPQVQLNEANIPQMAPEQYRNLLERLEKAAEKAKAEGKPFGRQKQLDKLLIMKAKGEF